MLSGLLSILGGLSPMVWIVAAAAVLAGTNAYTALKVHDHVESKYQVLLLNQKARVVEKEKEVLVLDQKTLITEVSRAVQRERKRIEQERKREETISNNPALESRVCLADDELRVWNDENLGTESVDRTSGNHQPASVPLHVPTGEVRDSSGPLAK
jgi:hypothetical protein